jgi:hypothetical protein
VHVLRDEEKTPVHCHERDESVYKQTAEGRDFEQAQVDQWICEIPLPHNERYTQRI